MRLSEAIRLGSLTFGELVAGGGAGRCALNCGLDPDALVQNMVVGLIGYFTEDGLSSDEWANPAGAK